MTICLAGVFKDSIVIGADTLTTAETLIRNETEGRVSRELSHKIKPVLGNYAFIFAGQKYLCRSNEDREAYSVNILINEYAGSLGPGDDPLLVFKTISGRLAEAYKILLGRFPAETKSRAAHLETFFLGYKGGIPFYWFFSINNNLQIKREYYESYARHALVRCSLIESFTTPNYGSEFYSRLGLEEGKVLISEMLREAYRNEIERPHPPRINEEFDIAVITQEGFKWDTRQRFRETHLYSQAISGFEEVE